MTVTYIRGEDDTVADALSRLPPDCFSDKLKHSVASILSVSADLSILKKIEDGYLTNEFCKQVATTSMKGWTSSNGLWYINDRLLIPCVSDLCEQLFRLVHDSLGHFGPDKSYASVRDAYYWPNMQWDLEQACIPFCSDKQEQRFCWGCDKWYNLKCLGNPTCSQKQYLDKQIEKYSSVPQTISKVAFQPTARGGSTHFVTGNIRLVSEARDLMDAQEHERVFAHPWMIAFVLECDGTEDDGDEWQAWLEHKYHICSQHRGNIMEEQLLIERQQMYVCPVFQDDNRLWHFFVHLLCVGGFSCIIQINVDSIWKFYISAFVEYRLERFKNST